MKEKRAFWKLFALAVLLVALVSPVSASETPCIHQPDQLWWIDDEDEHWQTCVLCGEKLRTGEHQWTRRMVEQEGNCEKDRVEVWSCDVCGRIVRRIIRAPGHDWDGGTVSLEPTCASEGRCDYACGRCGAVRQETIPKLAHESGTVWESGENQHWHGCLSCGGKTDTAYHDWTNWVTGRDQRQSRQCTVCGRTDSRKAQDAVAPDLVGTVGDRTLPKSFARGGEFYAVCGSEDEVVFQSRQQSFQDVRPNAWYYDEVQFSAVHGLLNGTGEGKFSPEGRMTRAMLAAVIYRMEGSPDAPSGVFQDVPPGTWYSDPVNWAGSVGLVNGVSPGCFSPNSPVTREQMVAILFRYAAYAGLNTTNRASLTDYADSGRISDYAVIPMEWAVAAGVVTGRENQTIAPKATTTRAEVAAVLMRMVIRMTEETGIRVN